MILDHDVVRVDGLGDLVDPALDHLGSLLHQVQRRDERGTRHARRLVHYRLLHVALNALQHGVVGDAAEGADGRSAVRVLLARHVLGERAGDDDDVVGDVGHLLDAQVEHAAEEHVLGLEQLGHGEERRRGLRGRQVFALSPRKMIQPSKMKQK